MERVGDSKYLKRVARTFTAPTPQQEKLAAAASTIQHTGPGEAEAAYMARQLVQCSLPHADPGNVGGWSRRNGNLRLTIQPGWDWGNGRPIGCPYGTLPRLLLFWVTTEALRTKTRRLDLGDSLADFMRRLGLDPHSRGKRSDAVRLREQMTRLFAARISFEETLIVGKRRGYKWLHMEVAPAGELWWDPKQPDQVDLWSSWLEIGENFYNAILAKPVPVDMRALKALKRSPLALDLYTWSGFKAYQVNKHNQPQHVPWRGLLEQFGADYDPQRIDNFKGKVKTAMRKVATVFPEGLNYTWNQTGITFLPGTVLPVPPQLMENYA